MNEKEVKEYIGSKNWKAFFRWMGGQTCGVNKDGSTNYYQHDVEAFKTKLETGYDRQKDPMAWD